MNTEEWKQVAEMVKERDGHKCVICGSTENLNAHHICYDGDCLDENDIVTLCNRCHECLHDGIKKMREAVSGGVYEMLSDKQYFRLNVWFAKNEMYKFFKKIKKTIKGV